MYVKPYGELKIRTAAGDSLPAEGAEVELDQYWARLLKLGHVVPAAPPEDRAGKTGRKGARE